MLLARNAFAVSAALALVAVSAVLSVGPALAQQSSTIRLETRNWQGARVSIEQGVRVWRPLPPTRLVVVNPGGRTPVALNVTDIRQQSTNTNYNHNYNYDGAPWVAGGSYGFGGYGRPYYGNQFGRAPGRPYIARGPIPFGFGGKR